MMNLPALQFAKTKLPVSIVLDDFLNLTHFIYIIRSLYMYIKRYIIYILSIIN